jgi:transposase
MSLTDAQWARIEPLLPDRTPKRGGRWRDHREVIDAIAFKFRTGTQWVHLPEEYGNWRGVCNRLRMWALDGTWERVFATLMAHADAGPRPVDVTALFPQLAPLARTATRLHPRPGLPTVHDSSVGGPLLWPADEPWPYCDEPYNRHVARDPLPKRHPASPPRPRRSGRAAP